MLEIDQKYGKSLVKIVKVNDLTAAAGLKHQKVTELTASVLLSGSAFEASYSHADNNKVIPTDTVKNTIYYLAKTSQIENLESFAVIIANHFIKTYPWVEGVTITLDSHDWTRVMTSLVEPVTDGISGSDPQSTALKPHPHSFYRAGNQKRTAHLYAQRRKGGFFATFGGGIKDLLVMKTTASSFVNFNTCPLTTLPPMAERILSTSIDASYNLTPRFFKGMPLSTQLMNSLVEMNGLKSTLLCAK